MVRVHVLDTGRVQVHRRQLEPYKRDALRLPATFLDREWTGWLGVWSFAIEHPQGLVVVDAGQERNPKLPFYDLYSRVAVRFDVTEQDLLENRLREAGLDPSAARHHIFTHLHIDHVGSGPLPGVRPTVSAAEWKAATRPGARLLGYTRGGIEDPLLADDGLDLYGDGAIRLIATPGHTAGHQSVLVTPSDGPRMLIAGDAVYDAQAVIDRRIDGVGKSARRARASIDRLRELCAEQPTVVLATHDPQCAERAAYRLVTAWD
ncbi:MAG: N-acyl homoserine lactonase family protein [Solirubrobacterales bacterium]